ncbi:Uncharacterized protein CGCA056_v003567 [Colletotrichum aenigma]|uniref:Uncharacterized protein n=1 Tax=Colletotrichum aenigma TaxID=1215731 RepID=UPI001872A934|nr:Uncharacterized protein CGCA056_v003567 [Colletotrichum aenigma]KAF5525133.1 Uncharacterized protein CGCA056_v003567 [Colletotrichum aenigma]
MAGRQSHGRPLLSSKQQPKNFRKSKSKAQAKALDAFTIASEQFPTKQKKTPRFREIDAQPDTGKKHRRAEEDDEDEDEDDDDEEQPRRKKAKASGGGGEGDDSEYGSDSEGNEWHYGVNEDEDSELDSDEAFGDSDEEDFQGYSFRGSKTAKNEADSEEDEDDDESLGEDAIDLAQALDEYESDESMEDQGSGSEGSESDSDADSPPSSDSDDGEDEEEVDPSKLGALQKFITSYGGEDEDAAPTKQKQKISFKDLGLAGVKDAQMRKSVKLMAKEEKETRPGAGKKLEVPLARRQQDKLQRAAAYETANETLGRWQETVKHNRRAEHLVFPLPQNAADEGLDNRELQALTAKNSSNELEQTIMSIMQQSGLAMNKQEENRMRKEAEEEGLSKEALKDLVNQRRREREIASRETKKAARIKKIKSKAYHRVHRKEKEREEMKLHEAMAENGEIDSEAEREAADRRRALERVGARHRDSKWAKLGASNKRAVWDDDYRAGLHDMARREEELRQRKEGRAGHSESEDESEEEEEDEGSDDEDDVVREKRKLLKQLKRIENEEDDSPASNLMKMKFMQKAEAMQKKANDELIAQIRRDIDSNGEASDEEEVTEVGRKKFGGAAKSAISAPALSKNKKSKKAAGADADDHDDDVPDNSAVNAGYSITAEPSTTGSAWSSGPRKKSSSKAHQPRVLDLDNSQAMTAAAPKPKSRSKAADGSDEEEDADSDEGEDVHLPLAIRDIAQMDKAFAGDDVVVDFAREKAEVEAEDDDKIVDNTLPGWGGWVGEGVSQREKKRQQGRFVTKVEGVKKADRKDAKLDRVIISEKRIKKNDKYLATQLPHMYESKAQYERSLRMPLGPEWVTKESFQEATKPRILKKQGIIAPMSRPTL